MINAPIRNSPPAIRSPNVTGSRAAWTSAPYAITTQPTNLTVTEVCHLVGYTGLGSFSSKFRQLVGVAPSEYQKRFAHTGMPHIPGCYVFMRGLADRRPDPAILEKPAPVPAS